MRDFKEENKYTEKEPKMGQNHMLAYIHKNQVVEQLRSNPQFLEEWNIEECTKINQSSGFTLHHTKYDLRLLISLGTLLYSFGANGNLIASYLINGEGYSELGYQRNKHFHVDVDSQIKDHQLFNNTHIHDGVDDLIQDLKFLVIWKEFISRK